MPRDPERTRAQKKANYERHKESILAYQKQYRAKNLEKIAAKQKALRELDPEKNRAKKREEYIRNRGKYLAYNAKKRAERIALNPSKPTLMGSLGMVGPYRKLSKEDQRRFQKAFREKNRDELLARRRDSYDPDKAAKSWLKYWSKNKAELAEKQRIARAKDPHKFKLRSKKWAALNKNKMTASRKRRYVNNREEMIARSVAYQAKNREKVRAWQKKRHKERYHSDPEYKLMSRLRCRFYEILKKQNQKSSKRLKLNKTEIRQHIEQQFMAGMTWENHGKVWHVDHIIPCTAFDFSDVAQIEQCFALANLRPLWARENIQKSDKIDHELLAKYGLTAPAQS